MEEPVTPRAGQLVRAPRYRALLVDDDFATREFVQFVFEEEYRDRCEIVTCSTLGEAVHMILHQPERRIDVVLLDLGLSETSGVETYEAFRQHVPDVPVIVFTGRADDGVEASLRLAGAFDTIQKGKMTPLGLYQSICNAVLQGRYSGTGRSDVVKLPDSLLRDARRTQEDLRRHSDSLPPEDPDKVRYDAHLVGLELLAELSREVGALSSSVGNIRKEVDDLAVEHRSTRDSVVDLKIVQAKDEGETTREKLKIAGKVVAVLAAAAAGASWREVLQFLAGALK